MKQIITNFLFSLQSYDFFEKHGLKILTIVIKFVSA